MNPTTASPDLRHTLRHLLTHLLTPLLMCLGMALAYQGAFHQPTPHHLKVAVVGQSPQALGLAQGIQAKAGQALDVGTLPSRAAAEQQLRDRELVGAFLPDAGSPQLLVASANSGTSATAAEQVFRQVTAVQGTPLQVTDLAPTAPGDPTGQGLFFLLVALSIGSYGSVAVIGTAGAALSLRLRAVVGVATALVVSVIGLVTAGPVFHVVDHDYAAVWALSWLYSAGIVLIGIGLHSFLKRWTTLTLMVLFVMLNFTSSGGVFRPDLQPGFFGALHHFWNGAGFVEGARDLLYFGGGAGLGGRVLALALWLVAGLLTLLGAAWYERRQPAVAAPGTVALPEAVRVEVEEEEEQAAVGA
ncbi:hypothetical protein ABH930_005923 [Kitasatospora sp. GAS204A]|uniref:hypothetical protein n=1 Tax=unclassified Kitasatospora TaxID=2633591 RepID=UPI002474205B|nr:hypothetical protein [Kitasatospora sp. GAS204B]MDH6121850.1 hypothetical protein [Kitasatospora sp. GAS204B]